MEYLRDSSQGPQSPRLSTVVLALLPWLILGEESHAAFPIRRPCPAAVRNMAAGIEAAAAELERNPGEK